jgi:hypothetical protein
LIILSVRDEDAWCKSMMTTLWHSYCNFPNNRMTALYHRHLWEDDFPNAGVKAYRKHNDAVREASKGRKFLEYHVAKGWKPLCDFLDVEVPSRDFPRADDWAEYKARHAEMETLTLYF